MRVRRIVTIVGSLAWLSAGSGLVWAAEEGGGEPSLFAGNWGNVFWTLLTFFCLVLVLGRFAWGPILRTLKAREDYIRDSLAEAGKARQEAQKLFEDYQRQLAQAREEANAIAGEGRKNAEAIKQTILEQARAEAEQMIARAKKEIQTARDDALKEIYDRTAELAVDIAAKIISRELTPADHHDLVRQLLQEMEQTVQN